MRRRNKKNNCVKTGTKGGCLSKRGIRFGRHSRILIFSRALIGLQLSRRPMAGAEKKTLLMLMCRRNE